jgi:hypothetical protein
MSNIHRVEDQTCENIAISAVAIDPCLMPTTVKQHAIKDVNNKPKRMTVEEVTAPVVSTLQVKEPQMSMSQRIAALQNQIPKPETNGGAKNELKAENVTSTTRPICDQAQIQSTTTVTLTIPEVVGRYKGPHVQQMLNNRVTNRVIGTRVTINLHLRPLHRIMDDKSHPGIGIVISTNGRAIGVIDVLTNVEHASIYVRLQRRTNVRRSSELLPQQCLAHV